jgi:elongation factor P
MIEAIDLKRNMMIELDGKPYQVIDVSISSPSARAGNTIVRTKVRCLLDGTQSEKPFRSTEKFEEPDVERRDCQYLYADDRFAHFMDSDNFEQFEVALGDLEDSIPYLYDGMPPVGLIFWNGTPVDLKLPAHVELEIVETEPSIKGVTATAQTKTAKLSTGLTVLVPAYISGGEVVRVDTRTGEYLGRVGK